MKKIKYFYNTNTLRYEKLVTPFRVKLLRIFGFLSALLVSSFIVIVLYNKFVPKDPQMQRKLDNMKDDYNALNDKAQTLEQQMAELEERDNKVYRSIFEATPLPDSARAKLIEQKKEIEKVQVMSDNDLGKSIAESLNSLSARVAFQQDSYNDIEKLIKNQGAKLSKVFSQYNQ